MLDRAHINRATRDRRGVEQWLPFLLKQVEKSFDEKAIHKRVQAHRRKVLSRDRHDLTKYWAPDSFVYIVAMNHALLDKHGVILHVKSSEEFFDT